MDMCVRAKCKLGLRQKQLYYIDGAPCAVGKHLHRWHVNTKLAKNPA